MRSKKLLVRIALIICIAFLIIAYGIFNAISMRETKYTFNTDKIDSDLRIAFISDIHLSTCFDGEGFNERLDTIKKASPDILLIGGDFIDGNTLKKDILVAIESLDQFDTKYGIYFVEGNHERYGKVPNIKRDFDAEYFENLLLDSKVKFLKDDVININDNIALVGRRDIRDKERKDVDLKSISNKYSIVLTHQPKEYEYYADNNVDLVLSGHTHVGQVIIGRIFMCFHKFNDLMYGNKKIKNTNFIVTSGMGSWLIPYKPAKRSEYVIIDIKATN